jgi:hypothetical protein
VRLLEVDEDTQAYGRGHIAGALGVHWRDDLQDPVRRDFIGATWDHIRGRAAWAIRSIRQAVETLPQPYPPRYPVIVAVHLGRRGRVRTGRMTARRLALTLLIRPRC